MKSKHPRQIKALVQTFMKGTEAQTLSEYWESTSSSYWMLTLLGHAYQDGALSRRRLVSVSLRCVETCAHLLPDEVHMKGLGGGSSRSPLECLAKLSSWCAGDDVDLTVVRDTMRSLCWTHRNRLLGNFKHIEDFEEGIGVRYDDVAPVMNLTSALDAALEVADAAGVGHGLGADDAYADAIVQHARFAVVRAGDAFGIGASGALADVIRDELDTEELWRVLFGDEQGVA